MNPTLSVYLHDKHVANLWMDNKYYCFQYITRNTAPISLTLPVCDEPYLNDAAKAYFANLLPEGDTRTAIEGKLGVTRGDDFELLKILGGDCAGAITVFPSDQAPADHGRTYTPLSDDELIRLIRDLPQSPLCAGRSKSVRLSLAGAQKKMTLRIHDAVYYLPENGAPSSHILKIPITNIPGIVDTVENETFVMMLAREVGLNVPDVELVKIGDIPVFITRRYDRYKDGNGDIHRLLQEDFCQLTGLEPTVKYQNAGGPSLETCAEILRKQSSNSIADIEQLIRWVLFNFMVGNTDAHAKNISMLWTISDGIRLAPFYDILSTTIYGGNHDDEFAMSIGREYHPAKVTSDNWKQLAECLDVNFRLISTVHADLATRIEPAVAKILAVFENRYYANKTVTAITGLIDAQVRLLSGML